MFVGVGASRVRDLFEQGKKNAPCIIFIDEIDAVGRHRGAGLGGGHDEREQTLNQLLVEMDGFESNDGVIIIAATNRPDVLDPALLRPGRFDRRIVVSASRRAGPRWHPARSTRARCRSLRDVDLEVIARGTPGFSGADLEYLVNEAALIAARRDKDKVEMDDFEEAKDKVLMGAERRSMIISDKEKRTTADPRSGPRAGRHVRAAAADPVHKVTIIPRGCALGVTQQLPPEDRLNMTREFAPEPDRDPDGRPRRRRDRVRSEDDRRRQRHRARHRARPSMVTEWGMSDEFGPLNFSAGSKKDLPRPRLRAAPRLLRARPRAASTPKSATSSTRNYARAREILTDAARELERIGEALLEYETLDGEEVERIVSGLKIERPVHRLPRPTAVAEGQTNPEQEEGPLPLPCRPEFERRL